MLTTSRLCARLLGEPATGQKYIETVPGRGYRFAAGVREIQRRESGPWLESRLPPVKPVVARLVQRRDELQFLDGCFGSVLMEVDRSRIDDVENSLRRALEVARGQGALCLELRAAVSLVCL